MSNLERTTSWQQIQQGMKEAERLIAGKNYNLVMVKARQTLECMVRCMAERACLVEGDLSDTIDQLYEEGWIDKSTKDHYHTIRILGNKAVHENDNTAYNADQAYQLLAQEVHVFANEFNGAKTPRARGTVRAQERTAARSTQTSSSARGAKAGTGKRTSYQGSGRSGAPRRKKKRRGAPVAYLWRLLIPILIVILLIVVIRFMMAGKSDTPKDTTAAPQVTTEAVQTEPEEPTETETEPQAEGVDVYRIKGNSVNVRSEPSTDSRIVTQLSAGTEIEYVKRYNNDWTVINYDGQEAYVSSQYIEKVEPETTAEPESAAQE